jgi:DNA-binding response OmpR family regulator
MTDPKHILIVENDATICELLGMALTDRGYSVSLAHSAAEARVFLRDRNVDFLIADVVMPGESGVDLAEHAKTLGVRSLLMSGEFATQLALKDDRAFIRKPFSLRELTNRILQELQTPSESRG